MKKKCGPGNNDMRTELDDQTKIVLDQLAKMYEDEEGTYNRPTRKLNYDEEER